MTSAQVIFLDEPTINLDEERRIELAERLSEISGLRGLKQLFIITHDDTFSNDCDHVISVTKENGISCVETDSAAVP